MKSVLKKVLIVLLALVVLLVGGVGLLFRNEIRTLTSIEKLDDYGAYTMTYYSDYGLQEMLDQGGVENDNELVSFLIGKILKGLPLEFNLPDFGCSTFQVQNGAGQWLFGRNFDLDYAPAMLVKTQPKDGYASISTANIGILGFNEEHQPGTMVDNILTLAAPYMIMDGMNEKGVSLGVLLIKTDPTAQTGKDLSMTTTATIRYVLDRAATVEEAIAIFESVNMRASAGASYHFQIADANGDSAIIEYIGNDISVIRKGEGTPMQLTNFLVSPQQYHEGMGRDRYAIILDAVTAANGIMEMEDAMDVLESVSQDSYDGDLMQGSNTQWSVVYNNSDLTMDICFGGQFDQVHTIAPFA